MRGRTDGFFVLKTSVISFFFPCFVFTAQISTRTRLELELELELDLTSKAMTNQCQQDDAGGGGTPTISVASTLTDASQC